MCCSPSLTKSTIPVMWSIRRAEPSRFRLLAIRSGQGFDLACLAEYRPSLATQYGHDLDEVDLSGINAPSDTTAPKKEGKTRIRNCDSSRVVSRIAAWPINPTVHPNAMLVGKTSRSRWIMDAGSWFGTATTSRWGAAEPRTAPLCLACKVRDPKHQPSKGLDKTANRPFCAVWWMIRGLDVVHGPWLWLFDHHAKMRHAVPRAF